MPEHQVNFSVPARPLERADIVFDVLADGEKLGTLEVSKGSVVWWPKGTTNGWKMGWERLDAVFKEHAIRQERR